MAHTTERAYTNQLYFPEATTDAVFGCPSDRDRPNRDITNVTDGIFATGGDPVVLDIRMHGDGYLAAARLHL
jgi:hypothetical protein